MGSSSCALLAVSSLGADRNCAFVAQKEKPDAILHRPAPLLLRDRPARAHEAVCVLDATGEIVQDCLLTTFGPIRVRRWVGLMLFHVERPLFCVKRKHANRALDAGDFLTVEHRHRDSPDRGVGTERELAVTGSDEERVALVPGHVAGVSHRPKCATQGGDVLPTEVV